MENVNDVVCLLFLSYEEDTYIFYDNENDTIGTFIYFAVMEDETIVVQKIIIISNNKLQIIFPKHFVVVSYEYKPRYCSCTYNKHHGFFNGNIFIRHGKSFPKWWYQDCFDKITVQSDTYVELSHENRKYTLAYVRADKFDDKSYKNKVSQLLG